MVLLMASLWLIVEGCEEKPKVEEIEKPKSGCNCCGIGAVTGAASRSAFAIAQSMGMSTVLGLVAAPLAIGAAVAAAVGGTACLVAAATTTCEC